MAVSSKDKRHSSGKKEKSKKDGHKAAQSVPTKKRKSRIATEEDLPRSKVPVGIRLPFESGPVPMHLEEGQNSHTTELEGGEELRGQGGEGDKKRKKRRTGVVEEEELDEATSFLAGQLEAPLHAARLKVGELSAGSHLLGSVAELRKLQAVISLPNGQMGYLDLTEVSDSLNEDIKQGKDSEVPSMAELFFVGQLLRCVVLQRDKKQKTHVELSVRPKLLNRGFDISSLRKGMMLDGSIKSAEDHGFVVDVGIDGVRAFLGKDQVPPGKQVHSGAPVHVYVSHADSNSRTVSLSLLQELVQEAIENPAPRQALQQLKAGTLVSAHVLQVLEDGIFLNFMDYFTGTIHRSHLKSELGSLQKFRFNQRIAARIIFIDYESQTIALSIRSNLLSLQPYEYPHGVGTGKCFESSVANVTQHRILLELNSEPKQIAFVKETQFSDDKIANPLTHFPIGSIHKCRVLKIHNFDGNVEATMKVSNLTSTLPQSVETRGDAVPGVVVEGIILEVREDIIRVSIGETLKGVITSHHFADHPLKNHQSKFKANQKVKCRVLYVNAGSIFLTNKTTMVTSRLSILSSYSDCTPNTTAHGFITQVHPFGCNVSFYGNVHGFVHKSEYPLNLSATTENAYQIGQVVKCRVLAYNPEGRGLTLSFNKPKVHDKIEAGSLIQGIVVDSSPASVYVRTDYGTAVLQTQHLSDFPSISEKLKGVYTPGTKIRDMLVLETGNRLVCTLKQSLKIAMKEQELPSTIGELHPGSAVYGFVKATGNYGCVVGFLNGLAGMAPKSQLCEGVGAEFQKDYFSGRSIQAHILRVDDQKAKLSLKPSLCPSNDVRILQHYFQAQLQLAQHKKKQVEDLFRKFPIGASVDATVADVRDFGLILSFGKDTVTGVVLEQQIGKGNHMVGSLVRALVLDIDAEKGVIDLSLLPKLVKAGNRDAENLEKQFTALTATSPVNGTIEMVKQNYLVLSIGKDLLIGFAPVSLNDLRDPFSVYTVGSVCDVTPQQIPSHSSNERLLVNVPLEVKRSAKAKVTVSKKDIKEGAILSGVVMDLHPGSSVLVRIGTTVGRAFITDIDDVYAEDPISKFTIGQTVQCCILKINEKRVDISLRPSRLGKNQKNTTDRVQPEILFANQLSVGDVVQGYIAPLVKGKQSKNVCAMLSSSISGHIAISSDEATALPAGKLVTTRVTQIIPRLSLELLSTENEVESGSSESEEDEDQVREEEELPAVRQPVLETKKQKSQPLKFDVLPGFDWGNGTQRTKDGSEESDDEVEEENLENGKNLSKRIKQLERKKKEQMIMEKENLLLQQRPPETDADFERILLSSPNNSYIWINYMALHISLTEIEKARSIAQRALNTISIEAEKEKLNVWVAWMNLENLYGSEDSLKKVFQNSLQRNDPQLVHLKLVEIYERSSNFKQAEMLYQTMCRKFKQSSTVWTKYGAFLLEQGKAEEFQRLLQDCLKQLPQKKHVPVLSKFAQMEYDFGSVERGRTLFEGILSNYSKRPDIWSIYLDMETKKGDVDTLRTLFERVTALHMSSKKMKIFFKRYLAFEKQNGNADTIAHVKQRATEYVELKSKA